MSSRPTKTRVNLPPGSPGLKRRASAVRPTSAKASRPKPTKREPSKLEETFAEFWAQFGVGPAPLREFQFAKDIPNPRRFRFDFAWPESRVAVEIEGATMGRGVQCHKCKAWVRAVRGDGNLGGALRIGGAHSTAEGIQRDVEKNNLALELGWAVMRFTSQDIRGNAKGCVERVGNLIRMRAGDERAVRQRTFFEEF